MAYSRLHFPQRILTDRGPVCPRVHAPAGSSSPGLFAPSFLRRPCSIRCAALPSRMSSRIHWGAGFFASPQGLCWPLTVSLPTPDPRAPPAAASSGEPSCSRYLLTDQSFLSARSWDVLFSTNGWLETRQLARLTPDDRCLRRASCVVASLDRWVARVTTTAGSRRNIDSPSQSLPSALSPF